MVFDRSFSSVWVQTRCQIESKPVELESGIGGAERVRSTVWMERSFSKPLKPASRVLRPQIDAMPPIDVRSPPFETGDEVLSVRTGDRSEPGVGYIDDLIRVGGATHEDGGAIA